MKAGGPGKENRWSILAALALSVVCACVSAYCAETGATARQTGLFNELLTLKPEGYAGPEPWMLEVWDTDMGLEECIALPTGPGNAASVFLRLETLYASEKDALMAGGEETRGVLLLIEAADMAECGLTPEAYPEFSDATAKQPDFIVLRQYLRALLKRGESAHRAGNMGEAERCFRAAIVAGKHLTDDRVSALVFMTGMIFKLRGAQALESFRRVTGETARADAVKRYMTGVSGTLRLLYWKVNQGLSEFAGFASLPCIVRIALYDKEPCWRKEAVVRLAVLRHGVFDRENNRMFRNRAFERTAEEALAKVAASDPDPTVRRMAVWAARNIRPEHGGDILHVFDEPPPSLTGRDEE